MEFYELTKLYNQLKPTQVIIMWNYLPPLTGWISAIHALIDVTPGEFSSHGVTYFRQASIQDKQKFSTQHQICAEIHWREAKQYSKLK